MVATPQLKFLDRLKTSMRRLFQQRPQPDKGPLEVSKQNDKLSEEEMRRRRQEFERQGGVSPHVEESPMPTQSPSPTPSPNPLEAMIRAGLRDYGSPPMATMSAQLAQAGQGLPHSALPAALALKESSGLKPLNANIEAARRVNNPFGIMGSNGLIQYPNLNTAILGGGPRDQSGLIGLLQGPRYSRYRNTGNLADFLRVYTPPNAPGNVPLPQQVNTLNALLNYFR